MDGWTEKVLTEIKIQNSAYPQLPPLPPSSPPSTPSSPPVLWVLVLHSVSVSLKAFLSLGGCSSLRRHGTVNIRSGEHLLPLPLISAPEGYGRVHHQQPSMLLR